MSREPTSGTTLANLREEAKCWLGNLRAGDEQARARLLRVHPTAPAEPELRDVRLALAREYGLPGWTALKAALADIRVADPRHVERVLWFLENACPDHHVRGSPDHVMARHTAMQILSRHPEIARDNVCTAVVCGKLEEVERILARRPQAASEKTSATSDERADVGGSRDRFKKELGPKGWELLLYLCFTRLPLPTANDNAVAVARTLLDHGADPNAYFRAGSCRYTPLVGVIGEGEEHRSPHPQRDALTRLLLERGAEPYDTQVLYNLHFRGDFLWFLRLIHERSMQLGRQADWADPNWRMLDQGPYGCGARYLLGITINNDNLELAEWLLEHGANPNAPPAPGTQRWRPPQTTLYEEAVRTGNPEVADLLQRFGATASAPLLEGEEAFVAACLRLDREKVKAPVHEHPEFLASTATMFAAARKDRADEVALLLDAGMSPDVKDARGQSALHVAAYHDAARVAALLIERGAGKDPVDSMHDGTPLWWAIKRGLEVVADLLSHGSSPAAQPGS
jgi:hypothetical protein